MECPKCGYDRQPEDTHCALCGVDFGLLDRLAAEKKQLKAMQKAHKSRKGGAGPGLEMEAPSEPEKTDDAIQPAGECPKCGAPRNTKDIECPHCGVIYEKHEQMLAQKKQEEEEKRRAEEKRFLEEKARIQREAEEGIRREREKRAAAAKRSQAEKAAEEQATAEDTAGKASPVKASPLEAIRPVLDQIRPHRKKITIAVIAALAVIVTVWGAVSLVSGWKERTRQEEILQERRAEEKRAKEARAKALQAFRENRNAYIQNLKALIDERKFDEYAAEIKKYDVPELQADLEGVKRYLEEIQLYDQAKWIPASEYGKNYDIYRKLNQYDPNNATYRKKMDYYRAKYAQQNYLKATGYLNKKKRVRADLAEAIVAINKAIALEGSKKKYQRVLYRLKNAELLFYEGNDNLQMAVRNDGLTKGATGGQRKIYVWLKNVGTTPYFINVDYFTLIGTNNKRYSYNNCSRELIVNLQPGQETGGYLYFYTSSRPSELVFDHINAGRISRKFP